MFGIDHGHALAKNCTNSEILKYHVKYNSPIYAMIVITYLLMFPSQVAGLSAGCYLRVQIVKEDIDRWQNSYS